MRILFALAGLHRVERGAEVAFISIASELARAGEEVTLIGSGPQRPGAPYRYLSAGAVPRERFERFPGFPPLRSPTIWEEASFAPGLLRHYRPGDYDVTVTCSYPFTNWILRRPARSRPPHVFVTQNGIWPAISNDAEYRFFSCDGLVCTNPAYFAQAPYPAALIGNGVDLDRFHPGASERHRFGLAGSGPIVLMASAMNPSKHIDEAIEAVSQIPDARLVVAGDGPQRSVLARLAAEKLPGRYHPIQLPATDMPALYRSADVFVHLSRSESFGNVYVEALASGLPVIAVDSAHTRWIFGDDAFFVPPAQPDAIAEQIRSALLMDQKKRTQLAVRAGSFGWASVASKYRDFLSEIAGA